jgi:protein TonB
MPQLIDDGPPLVEPAEGGGAIAGYGVPDGIGGATFSGPPRIVPPAIVEKPEAPPAPVPAVKQRYTVGGKVRPPKLIHEVRPAYPPLARQARIAGTVKIEAVLATDGTVQALRAVSGHPLLVQAALDAVRQWRYEPTLLNTVPVEVSLSIDVNFTLTQ